MQFAFRLVAGKMNYEPCFWIGASSRAASAVLPLIGFKIRLLPPLLPLYNSAGLIFFSFPARLFEDSWGRSIAGWSSMPDIEILAAHTAPAAGMMALDIVIAIHYSADRSRELRILFVNMLFTISAARTHTYLCTYRGNWNFHWDSNNTYGEYIRRNRYIIASYKCYNIHQ